MGRADGQPRWLTNALTAAPGSTTAATALSAAMRSAIASPVAAVVQAASNRSRPRMAVPPSPSKPAPRIIIAQVGASGAAA
ncbi:hypothetical protein DFR50_111150 [Roseiarcus fermentans]|uniref:Uncharacterized protein n=1 Tax=Roseiarcus fermentans TaxID=1473586 RepID=A0A366FGV4_9HYPH|nr:hypothetical protein DFR50_111150 [Roseiarcus fermentans]